MYFPPIMGAFSAAFHLRVSQPFQCHKILENLVKYTDPKDKSSEK